MEKTKAIKYQIIKVTVTAEGETVSFNVNTDKMYKKITGILASFPFYISFLQKSTLFLSINDKEIFPDDFEAKLISFGPGISANDMFYLLNEEANGSTIKGKFKDGTDALGFPYPYTMNLYLRLEEKV